MYTSIYIHQYIKGGCFVNEMRKVQKTLNIPSTLKSEWETEINECIILNEYKINGLQNEFRSIEIIFGLVKYRL